MKHLVLTPLIAVLALVGQARAQGPRAPTKGKAPSAKETAPTAEQAQFFEKHIRPVLVTTCFKCHNSENGKVRGGLALDTREGLRKGGDGGAVLVPGQPAKSRLLKALRHQGDLKMPPKDQLPNHVVADFERWVAMGAPDPRGSTTRVGVGKIDIEKGKKFWSFQPVKKTAAPAVKDRAWPRTDIDRYLLAALEKKGLRPVADADRHVLLRRVHIDLTGLPPTPAEIESFLKDRSPDAFAKVVDKLLASKHYGERWGRHWLDVARYAESSGKQVNFNYPYAWRYRDYVIAAFNKDKPFNRFILEQLSGDLLPYETAVERAEQQIATGFLALGPKLHVENNRLQFRMDVVDEQIDTTTQAFLGLTVACARCHDHKFDPIPMGDYYALAGIFRSTETLYGTIPILQNNHPSRLISLSKRSGVPAGMPKMTEGERRRLLASIKRTEERRAELFKKRDRKSFPLNQVIFTSLILSTQRGRLDAFEADGSPKLLAMGARDRVFTVDSPLYARGEVSKPGQEVPRGLIQVLSTKSTPRITEGSGRRELAHWVASKDNPLTARVMANRTWLHLFGRGLVPTPDNFGNAGLPPSHPELLDHLAASFMADGWSVKKLIRSIVLSRAYQLSAKHDAKNHEIDPDNELVWRMSKRRLDAEALRDSILAVSGQLETTPPIGSPVAAAGEGYSRGGFGGGRFGGGPADGRATHRSVYLPVLRDQPLESLSLFDFADPNLVVAQRASTAVPAQALYLLNNPFVMRQADAAAARLLEEGKDENERIRIAFLRFLGRPPSAGEAEATRVFLREAGTRRTAWSSFCQALIASADFLYRS